MRRRCSNIGLQMPVFYTRPCRKNKNLLWSHGNRGEGAKGIARRRVRVLVLKRSLSSSVASVCSVKPEPELALFPEAFGDRLDGVINCIVYLSRILAVSMYLPRYCEYACSWKLAELDCGCQCFRIIYHSIYSFRYSSLPSNFFDSATFLTALLKSSWFIESR